MIILANDFSGAAKALDGILTFIIPWFMITLMIALTILVAYFPVILYTYNNKKKSDKELQENREFIENARYIYMNKTFNDTIAKLTEETKELMKKKKILLGQIEEAEVNNKKENKKPEKTKKTDKKPKAEPPKETAEQVEKTD